MTPAHVEKVKQQSNEETIRTTVVYSIPPPIGTISPGVEEVRSSKKNDKMISMSNKIAPNWAHLSKYEHSTKRFLLIQARNLMQILISEITTQYPSFIKSFSLRYFPLSSLLKTSTIDTRKYNLEHKILSKRIGQKIKPQYKSFGFLDILKFDLLV